MKYSAADQKALVTRSKAFLAKEEAVVGQSVEAQLTHLRELIVFHEWRYYIQNDPLLSDYE
ncbi:MAG: hypothetical protein AAFO02_05960, partial [Bacteroidota bacterium]